MLWPLSVAQVISWGTLFYSFSLFAGPMRASLGWELTALNGALTTGLLVTGLMAYPVGALLDRHGGQWLMSAGSLGAGALLLAWSRVESLTAFYALWVALGACMSAVLIEAAFAVIHQHFGADARRGMTAFTLVTGLSGTVFVPLIGYLIARLDWRDTLLVLGAFHFLVCLPAHWLFVPPRRHASPEAGSTATAGARAVMRARLHSAVFWGLVLWVTSYSLTASSLIFQLVPVLTAEGVPAAHIYLCFALIGPAQVLSRVFVVTAAGGASTVRLGTLTTTIVPIGLLVLLYAPPTLFWLCVFAACFGTGHGITTILRGVAPAEWLGREHYGRMMGAIALPMMIAMAVAPSLTALVWSATGSPAAVWWTILSGALVGTGGFWLAVLARR